MNYEAAVSLKDYYFQNRKIQQVSSFIECLSVARDSMLQQFPCHFVGKEKAASVNIYRLHGETINIHIFDIRYSHSLPSQAISWYASAFASAVACLNFLEPACQSKKLTRNKFRPNVVSHKTRLMRMNGTRIGRITFYHNLIANADTNASLNTNIHKCGHFRWQVEENIVEVNWPHQTHLMLWPNMRISNSLSEDFVAKSWAMCCSFCYNSLGYQSMFQQLLDILSMAQSCRCFRCSLSNSALTYSSM